ncbi:MAG TPA: hypothetical protein VIM16_16825 [Mucilaginibacter sp.]|jgi:hypothetical protein
MLKHLTVWLLIFSVLTVNYSRLFVYAGFKLNQTYIAAKLCENRNKPWLHCNGKCYLMKKIKQAEEKQNNAERESQKNLIQEAYFKVKSPIKFYTFLIQIITIPNDRFELPEGDISIFRPPQLG